MLPIHDVREIGARSMNHMKERLAVSLEPRQLARLRACKEETGSSLSEILRKACDCYFAIRAEAVKRGDPR